VSAARNAVSTRLSDVNAVLIASNISLTVCGKRDHPGTNR